MGIVHLEITGALIVDGKQVSLGSRPFPSDPKMEFGGFTWDWPSAYQLASEEVIFVARARDESGFASTDTLRFLGGCPLGGRYDEYPNPDCPK